MWYAYLIAKIGIDYMYEFGAGILGKMVGKNENSVIHTYHTMYEDYLHYIAKKSCPSITC